MPEGSDVLYGENNMVLDMLYSSISYSAVDCEVWVWGFVLFYLRFVHCILERAGRVIGRKRGTQV